MMTPTMDASKTPDSYRTMLDAMRCRWSVASSSCKCVCLTLELSLRGDTASLGGDEVLEANLVCKWSDRYVGSVKSRDRRSLISPPM
ncbi:hypothetical protein PHSY_006421 [Pseudozyma hubeiensis SY62]|uniref:Uncharacterized protein n=1 Tax=Pseudozyma hubeiensis (strain SY62) TaxID=1305764 RepID=R9PBU6_PSEHS|nr:hypothetical protein PHSY_006421 [Pseudozyma hubeiensis SY62]GAC98826.1 hypothetical protein PHSY_006421 [Pseudozyma hubeiensis SY62]